MGRYLPTDCPHGGVMDWGDFGNECDPTDGLCPMCFTPDELAEMLAEYRADNVAYLKSIGCPEIAGGEEQVQSTALTGSEAASAALATGPSSPAHPEDGE